MKNIRNNIEFQDPGLPGAALDGSWFALRTSCGGLGPLLKALGPLLGALGPLLRDLGSLLGDLGGEEGRSWPLLGRS